MEVKKMVMRLVTYKAKYGNVVGWLDQDGRNALRANGNKIISIKDKCHCGQLKDFREKICKRCKKNG